MKPRHPSMRIGSPEPKEPKVPKGPDTLVDCPLCFGLVGHQPGDENRKPDPDCPLCAGVGSVSRAQRRAFRDAHGSPASTHPADKD